MDKLKKFFKKCYFYLKGEEKGQMLLLVLVVVLLLMIILIAIIVNVRVDIKQTQSTREYEKGYSNAEEDLFKINSEGFANWNSTPGVTLCTAGATDACLTLCPTDYTCYKKCDGDVCTLTKRKFINGIEEMLITKDDTLEVMLHDSNPALNASGDITTNWDGQGLSIMLVCKNASNEYSVSRFAVCKSGSCPSGSSGFLTAPAAGYVVNVTTGCTGATPWLMRIRAVGSDASNVTVSGILPPQMEDVRVQGYTKTAGETASLPGPEVYTKKMIHKRLPALFDYVLFVANGDVGK
jgi:hypothetical protein